ncbi:hypothetical protein AB7C87_19660 [Natrarchaeobius sp. A-rgal3]|uniref:hypothetical protein n=1 Tax=Natrarchaeobius versutus TaxID=1679078 RepID=UPI00350F3FE8
MNRDDVDDVRWGWTCPRCNADADVERDPSSKTFRWVCSENPCPAVGFGFTSRRRARIALRDYRNRDENVYR